MLKYDSVYASLLSNEMGRKYLEGVMNGVLYERVHSHERKNRHFNDKPKCRGRYKYPI